ncbi:peroxidase family protein [Solicola sp. PLA-1-18]|uniref:peroxidase family protein n=1 Tax=Solicola sp. PLA-1-18 TaxID=3380532 RepID=UPI003B807C0D
MKRHLRDNYYVVGEGVVDGDAEQHYRCHRPSTEASLRKFRFSRLGPQGEDVDRDLAAALATRMTEGDKADPDEARVPSGYTYLSQFVDHDMTLDKTAVHLGDQVTVAELKQGRSPSLDLDSLYGRGPQGDDARFYAPDGVHLLTGTTAPAPSLGVAATALAHEGFDLPRVGFGSTKAARRAPLIPDGRNDENLVVGQTHAAFIRFHNRVVDTLAAEGTPSHLLLGAARDLVVRHYQWVLRHDMLPRLVDPAVVDDVFTHGRSVFEVPAPYEHSAHGSAPLHGYAGPGDSPTMPIEFSVGAYRLGHSMVRDVYEWNRVFNTEGGLAPGTLALLFQFSGTSGVLSPGALDLGDPDAGSFEVLPSNWIADWRRLYDFAPLGVPGLVVEPKRFNVAKRIDTLLVDPLKNLPLGSFGGRGAVPPAAGLELNLAFRNLVRGGMVRLASGQQMAAQLGVTPLTDEQLLAGDGTGVVVDASDAVASSLLAAAPLWFYCLREAEVNGGRLAGVGARITAEVFHRAMEGSATSIVRDPSWRPRFARADGTFEMADLLMFAFEGRPDLLNPLGD